ncbi:hypothetical protein BRN45_01605, partial [Xanthomonas oryzae pv. oryzae]
MRAWCTAKGHVHIERGLDRRSLIALVQAGLGAGHIVARVERRIGMVAGIQAEVLVVEHRGDIRIQHVAVDQDGDRAAAAIEPMLLPRRADHRLVGRITVGLLEIVVPIARGALAIAVAGVTGHHPRVQV